MILCKNWFLISKPASLAVNTFLFSLCKEAFLFAFLRAMEYIMLVDHDTFLICSPKSWQLEEACRCWRQSFSIICKHGPPRVLSQSVEMLHVLEPILKDFATYQKKMLYLTCWIPLSVHKIIDCVWMNPLSQWQCKGVL